LVVEPLFNTFTLMSDGPFKSSVLSTAADKGSRSAARRRRLPPYDDAERLRLRFIAPAASSSTTPCSPS
jgi:hypothetical protein